MFVPGKPQTLAYCENTQFTTLKSFILHDPGRHFQKFLLFLTIIIVSRIPQKEVISPFKSELIVNSVTLPKPVIVMNHGIIVPTL